MKNLNRNLMAAVSVIALSLATTAYAETGVKASADTKMETNRTTAQDDANIVTTEEIKRGWEDTKENVKETAENISDETKEALDTAFNNDITVDTATNLKVTAQNDVKKILGTSIVNEQGDVIGSIKDILVDSDGEAQKLIVADSALFGMGKQVALNMSTDLQMTTDGKYQLSLTEQGIDNIPSFKYEPNDMIGLYSLDQLAGANLLGVDNKSVADVNTILFENGHADRVVVSYDKFLGMGGKLAAFDFDDLRVTKESGQKDANFRLSANQETAFKGLIKASK